MNDLQNPGGGCRNLLQCREKSFVLFDRNNAPGAGGNQAAGQSARPRPNLKDVMICNRTGPPNDLVCQVGIKKKVLTKATARLQAMP